MQVIIKKKIEKLGDVGDIIIVKDGYARNYFCLLYTSPSPRD